MVKYGVFAAGSVVIAVSAMAISSAVPAQWVGAVAMVICWHQLSSMLTTCAHRRGYGEAPNIASRAA